MSPRLTVLDALHDVGRDVPRDVTVICFHNWEILSAHARPPLTSIDIDLEHLGAVAAQQLFASFDDGPRAGIERLPCRLVQRESTAPMS